MSMVRTKGERKKERIADYLPIWGQLSETEQKIIEKSAVYKRVSAGEMIYDGQRECTGLLLLCEGQLRAFILSEEGKEITLYRLLSRDICLFSASCIMRNIQFDITVSAEKDTSFWLIPTDVYQGLMEKSLTISHFTNEVMAGRLSDIMWLMEQIMWRSFDKRLATFLLEESALEESETISITHEGIAGHLGTAREVVTRMLKYFQNEKMISLSRGAITLLDIDRLRDLESLADK